jgi:hypothetical protein
MTPGQMIAAYLKLREKKKTVEDRHKEELAPYKEAMNKIENELLRQMNEGNLENLKSDVGTAYVATRSSATVADWDAFLDFLERRVSKVAAEEFLEEHASLPPGVSIARDTTVNIRKA